MGIFNGRVVKGGYVPSVLHRILKPKIAGNKINGLGETKFRRPTPIYHWFGKLKVPYNRVAPILYAKNFPHKESIAQLKRAAKFQSQTLDPVATKKEVKSAEEWAESVRNYALTNGADLVGIKRLRSDWVFEDFEISKEWVIILGFQMDYSKLSKAPATESGTEVLRVYANGQEAVLKLSNWFRSMGWEAEGFCGPEASPISMVPVALAAGFGELGKHGSIINRQLGSNLRLAYVLTDTPLIESNEDSFGAGDFCLNCQVCTNACPPGAISDKEQMVRGVKKWYVDFDKCLPYFNDNTGCGICIAVCPWSRPGVATNLIAKYEKRLARKANNRDV